VNYSTSQSLTKGKIIKVYESILTKEGKTYIDKLICSAEKFLNIANSGNESFMNIKGLAN